MLVVDIFYLDGLDYYVAFVIRAVQKQKHIGSVEIVEQTLDKKEQKWLTWMKIGAKLGCHQRSDRSFFYHGYQFPICARCTGVLIRIYSISYFIIFSHSLCN